MLQRWKRLSWCWVVLEVAMAGCARPETVDDDDLDGTGHDEPTPETVTRTPDLSTPSDSPSEVTPSFVPASPTADPTPEATLDPTGAPPTTAPGVTETPDPTLESSTPMDPTATPGETTSPGETPGAPSETPEPASPTPETAVFSGNYLLSVIACDTTTTDCGDPGNHQTWLAQSDDGGSWSVVPGYAPFTGSVPDVIRRGDTVYVYSNLVDFEADTDTPQLRRYDVGTGTSSDPIDIDVRTSDGSVENLVDISCILDEQDRMVIFYLYAPPGEGRSGCIPQGTSCTKYFHSATEVEGSDGTEFIVDEGDRAVVELNGGGSASDPDIFDGPDGFVMYVARGRYIQVFQAAALRDAYVADERADAYLTDGCGGVSAGHFDVDSRMYWTFLPMDADDLAVPGIRRAIHSSFDETLTEDDFTPVFNSTMIPGLEITSGLGTPGFALNIP